MQSKATGKTPSLVSETPNDIITHDDTVHSNNMRTQPEARPEARTIAQPEETNIQTMATMALETVIVFVSTVILPTLSVHYAMANAHGFEYRLLVQEDILRVMGSMWVDITTIYFILYGYIACENIEIRQASGQAPENQLESGTTETKPPDTVPNEMIESEMQVEMHMNTLRDLMPDLIASTLPYFLLILIAPHSLVMGHNRVWTLVYLSTSPLLMSTLFDFRIDRYFRCVNESMWMAQLAIIFSLISPQTYRALRKTTDDIANDSTWKLLSIKIIGTWLMGFLHLYAAFVHPTVASAVTRSPFTNYIFFLTGMLIGMTHRNLPLQQRIKTLFTPLREHATTITCATITVMSAFYIHHIQNTEESDQCITVFGGTPCLWNVDICNLRFFPIFMIFILWFTDKGPIFNYWLMGPIESSLTHTLQHISKKIAILHPYNFTFMMYAQIIALIIDATFMALLPSIAVNYSTIFVIAEITVVTVGCVLIQKYISPLIREAFTRITPDWVATQTRRALRYLA